MPRSRPIALAGLLALTACGAAPAPVPAAAEPVAAEPVTAETTCDGFITRYRARLAAATGTCTTDADCGTYGGLDPETLCGGSTDLATSDALHALGDESDAAGCPRPGYSCPAIANHCEDGRCT